MKNDPTFVAQLAATVLSGTSMTAKDAVTRAREIIAEVAEAEKQDELKLKEPKA